MRGIRTARPDTTLSNSLGGASVLPYGYQTPSHGKAQRVQELSPQDTAPEVEGDTVLGIQCRIPDFLILDGSPGLLSLSGPRPAGLQIDL